MPTPTKVDGNFFDELELTRSVRGHLLKALLWHFAAPPKQLSASETQRTETVRCVRRHRLFGKFPDDPTGRSLKGSGFGQGLDHFVFGKNGAW